MLTFRYNLNKRNNNMAFLITKMLSIHICTLHPMIPIPIHSTCTHLERRTNCPSLLRNLSLFGFAKSIACDRVVLKGQGIEHFKSKTFLGSFMMTKILMIT